MSRRVVIVFAALAGVLAASLALGSWARLETVLENYGAITAYVRANFVPALAIYFSIYVLVVVFSLPVALFMTLFGGALFGGVAGGLTAVLAATTGATMIFLAARGLLHDYFVQKAGTWLGPIRKEFNADAASYLLLLRLTPVFPFAAVNIAAGLLGARLPTYLWTTFFGIMPGTAAYSYVGSGLSGALEAEAGRLAACRAAGNSACAAGLDPASFISRDIGIGLAGLGLLVLISILVRKYAHRGAAKVSVNGAAKDQ